MCPDRQLMTSCEEAVDGGVEVSPGRPGKALNLSTCCESPPQTPPPGALPRTAALRLSLPGAGFARLPRNEGLRPSDSPVGRASWPRRTGKVLPMCPDRSVTHVPGCTARNPEGPPLHPPSPRASPTFEAAPGMASTTAAEISIALSGDATVKRFTNSTAS
jgi:hypothetical protein